MKCDKNEKEDGLRFAADFCPADQTGRSELSILFERSTKHKFRGLCHEGNNVSLGDDSK